MFLCIYYLVQLLNKCEKVSTWAWLGQCNHGPLHVGRPEIWLNSWPAARGLGRDQAVPNTRPMDQKEKTVTDANLIKAFWHSLHIFCHTPSGSPQIIVERWPRERFGHQQFPGLKLNGNLIYSLLSVLKVNYFLQPIRPVRPTKKKIKKGNKWVKASSWPIPTSN